MADRPILFSAPMVKALLEGRKTQTRRIIKPQPPIDVVRHCWYHAPLYGFTRDHDVTGNWHVVRLLAERGDRLWVREAWKPYSTFDHLPPREMPPSRVFYLADETYSPSGSRGRPGIHMPRWASRLTLTVTDVRVERLQDISEEDARAEGCPVSWDGKPYDPPPPEVDSWQGYGRASFCLLWSKINGPGSWESNPWIVAYSFTVHIGNIDLIGKDAA